MMFLMGYQDANLPGSDSPKVSIRRGRKAMCSRVMESRDPCKVRVKRMLTYYSDTDLRVSSSEKVYSLRSFKEAEKVATLTVGHLIPVAISYIPINKHPTQAERVPLGR